MGKEVRWYCDCCESTSRLEELTTYFGWEQPEQIELCQKCVRLFGNPIYGDRSVYGKVQERKQLIVKLRELYKAHNEKLLKYQQEHGLSPEIGCLTREATEIAKYYPKIIELGITPEALHKGQVDVTLQ